MPIRVLLEEFCRAQHLVFAQRRPDELETDRQAVGEPARDAGRWQTAKVADAAQGIGKG